jgi:glycosyltransferase involved in cell wall biosynthesis
MTGTQRYTRELLRRLGDVLEPIGPEGRSRGLKGHLWEQLRLPGLCRPNLLWSPANTGPACYDRQVVTVHDLTPVDHPECMGRLFGLWYRRLWKKLLPRVRRILTVSRFTRQRILDVYGLDEDRVVVTPLAAAQSFRPAGDEQIAQARRAAGIGPEPYILTVGTIEPRKNLPRLLEAWKQVYPKHRGLRLVVVGAAGSEGVFGRSAQPSPPAGVLLAGRVEEAHLPGLYSGAELMVYPSLYEGFGLPPLEAMACGTPVVVSNAPALVEVVGQVGRIVQARDAGAIAEGILEVLEASDRQTLARKSLDRAACFSWDAAARATLDVLRGAQG